MKLISLQMENFRQHADSTIKFQDGITVISGSNGSGKSTVLEAISWALYGTEATRGNKSSIKWNKAPARSKVAVNLSFKIENEIYKVKRELQKAEVYLNENEIPLAQTQDEVTAYLTQKLGMTRQEFFNTYFTGQKELSFLGNQKPAERKVFISKVLNYEKVRETQEQIRVDKNNLNNEIIGIKQGLGDIDGLLQEVEQTSQKFDTAKRCLEEKEKGLATISLELSDVEPQWEKLKNSKDNVDKTIQKIEFLNDKKDFLSKNIQSLEAQLTESEEKNKKIEELEKVEPEYNSTQKRIEILEVLQEKDAQKQALKTKQESLELDIREKETQLEFIVESGKEKRIIIDKIPVLKNEINLSRQEISQIEQDLLSQEKEFELLISQKQQEIKKICSQLKLIQEKGENGTCPTCERPLADEFENVTQQLENNIDSIESEIKEFQIKLNANNAKPREINQKKELLEKKEAEYISLTKFEGQYQEERNRYKIVKKEIEDKTTELKNIETLLDKDSDTFDINELKVLREKYQELKKQNNELLTLKALITGMENNQKDLVERKKERSNINDELLLLETKLKSFKFLKEDFELIESKYNSKKESFYNAKELVIKAKSEFENIKIYQEKLKEQEKAHKSKLEFVKEKENDLKHLKELDVFYGKFLEKLNDQARPEISELASKHLNDLTDGRYTSLELNEKYEIKLIDEGEIKEVISGGEEDVANLSVRLAISQMIAQRSGKPLTLLILDEVFGSLDESRRNNVMTLLDGLTNSFEQVIVISHIDDIKENVGNFIKIEFDEEKGCSSITTTF